MKSSTLSRATGKDGQSLSGEVPVIFHGGVKCICGDPDLSSRRTIQCQVCGFWSHIDCVGNPGEFTCKTCTANNRLKALSYMDAVKANFHDRPGVYNTFLEIVKDYKCRITDTARTIERICHLFGNDPVLIQEFNIFLPRGYQLECSQDANGANYITITTPTETTTQTTNNAPG